MDFITKYSIFNYALALIYGLFLSVMIAGGWKNHKQRNVVIVLCLAMLVEQSLLGVFWNIEDVWRVYPLVIHVPIVLITIFVIKAPVVEALVSVLTAYMCCQIPRWFEVCVTALSGSAMAGQVTYTIVIIQVFFVLMRYFVKPAHSIITDSKKTRLLFGSVPFIYYVFDYATAVYSDILYSGVRVMVDLLPTVLIMFYIIFLSSYHQEMQKRAKAEREATETISLLKRSRAEMESMQKMQTQTAIYQHDMRHHLNILHGFLCVGHYEQALEYIEKTQENIAAINLRRYCESEAVNLICSSFAEKAKQMGISLLIDATLPKELSISDAELCAILSNGIENALNAVSKPEVFDRQISLSCSVKYNKLLIEIKNPYAGAITMQDGVPVSDEFGHGFGCRSIDSVVAQHHGLCSFEAKDHIFTARIVLPQ